MIEIIGFKLMTKGRTSQYFNVERNTFANIRSHIAESLAFKTFCKETEEFGGDFLRAGVVQRGLECKMLTYGWRLVKVYCFIANVG